VSADDRKADEAWLLARESAEAGAEVAAPSDETRRVYDALAAELAQLPAPRAPAGWRARMLAALDEPVAVEPPAPAPAPAAKATPRRRWWLVAAPLAAAAAALLVWRASAERPHELALHVEVRKGDVVRRAGEAPAVGDIFVARVLLPGAGELRVYRNGTHMVARCPGHTACLPVRRVGDRDEHAIELPMPSKGEYRALVIDGAIGLDLTGSLDGDARDAKARGAQVRVGDSIRAR
jgi:hypothetical protein